MNARNVLMGCLALLGLLWVVQPLSAADEDYTVVIKRVTVQQTKPNGDAWDVNAGKPDLKVYVRNLSDKNVKEFATETRDDTFEADFNAPTTFKFRPGETIEFEVVDADVAANDSIGKMQREMKADLFKPGALRLEKFGQVILLEVELKKL